VPQKLFSFVGMLVGMGITPLWPAYGEALARGDVAWVRKAFFGSLWLTFAISVPLCTLLALAGPWILRVFFGKLLYAPASLLMVLAVWGVVAAVSAPIAMLLNGAGALKVQTFTAVIAGSINLVLSIILTRRFGVIGVCSGSIITQVLITFPMLFFVVRDLFRNMTAKKAPGDAPSQLSTDSTAGAL